MSVEGCGPWHQEPLSLLQGCNQQHIVRHSSSMPCVHPWPIISLMQSEPAEPRHRPGYIHCSRLASRYTDTQKAVAFRSWYIGFELTPEPTHQAMVLPEARPLHVIQYGGELLKASKMWAPRARAASNTQVCAASRVQSHSPPGPQNDCRWQGKCCPVGLYRNGVASFRGMDIATMTSCFPCAAVKLLFRSPANYGFGHSKCRCMQD